MKNKGITLIALIITIIVLIILAGVTLNLLMGDNGILTRAKGAKEEFNKSKMLEDITLILMDYSAEHELTGITLENYLNKNNISFEKNGTNIKFIEEGYELTVNPITLQINGPTKANKIAKVNLNASTVNQNGSLSINLELGEDVDVQNCKYAFVKADVPVEEKDITTPVANTTIDNLSTDKNGDYYFYLLVAYKDGSKNTLIKSKVTIGTPVTGISLNKTSLELEKESIETLIATVEPSNAIQTVTWNTSNENIATVNSNGVVTAVAPGTAIITVTSNDDTSKTASCNVVVPVHLITSIVLNKTSETIEKGNSLQLTPSIEPENVTNKELEWKSSNTNIATVSQSGLVTAEESGTCTITAKAKDGSDVISNECTITVPKNELKTILEYPIMTDNGMVNVKYTNPNNANDYHYELDLSVDCTALDALDKAAYDNNLTTGADWNSGKTKFYIDCSDSHDVEYYIGNTPNSNSDNLLFKVYNANTVVGGIALDDGESAGADGWYHKISAPDDPNDCNKTYLDMTTTVYEIRYQTTHKIILDYPIMTDNGMVNVMYKNYSGEEYYELDLSVDCIAPDALDKAAYDNNRSTKVTWNSGKTKFFIDCTDAHNVYYYIGNSPSSSSENLLFQVYEPYDANRIVGGIALDDGESTGRNGWYHKIWAPDDPNDCNKTYLGITTTVYEIEYRDN